MSVAWTLQCINLQLGVLIHSLTFKTWLFLVSLIYGFGTVKLSLVGHTESS